MSSDLAITEDAPLASVDTAALRRELAAQITITAKALQRMGEIWVELERRGEDLSDLRHGLYAYLPMIASGKLRAELVVRFAGKAMLLRALATLPVWQQDKLLAEGEMEIVSRDDPASTHMIPLEDMRSEHVRVVFSPSGLRPVSEQRRFIQARAISVAVHKPQEVVPAYVSIDRDSYLRSGRRFVLDKNGTRISVDDLIDALSAHFDLPLREMVEKG